MHFQFLFLKNEDENREFFLTLTKDFVQFPTSHLVTIIP